MEDFNSNLPLSLVPSITSSAEFENYLPTSPVLSSRNLHWEHLLVRSYLEPSFLDETFFPASLDIYLVLITSGVVRVEERKQYGPWRSYVVKQGDWFLSPANGEPYALRWKSLSATPVATLHLHLSSNFFLKNARQLTEYDPTRLEVHELTGFQDTLLFNLSSCLQHEVQNSPWLSPSPSDRRPSDVYAENASYILVAHLLRHYAEQTGPLSNLAGSLSVVHLAQIKEFVLSHLDHQLSIENLAALVGFSPYHFARLYRQTTGLTPHQFVIRQRLDAAIKLLSESSLPLAEIALEVGFPNQSHFTHNFKRYTGLTPATYSRQFKKRQLFLPHKASFR